MLIFMIRKQSPLTSDLTQFVSHRNLYVGACILEPVGPSQGVLYACVAIHWQALYFLRVCAKKAMQNHHELPCHRVQRTHMFVALCYHGNKFMPTSVLVDWLPIHVSCFCFVACVSSLCWLPSDARTSQKWHRRSCQSCMLLSETFKTSMSILPLISIV